jgi:RND family efflux transporter MFP subunit
MDARGSQGLFDHFNYASSAHSIPDKDEESVKAMETQHSLLAFIHNSMDHFRRQPKRSRYITAAFLLALILLLAVITYTLWYSFLATQQVTVFKVGKEQVITSDVGGGGIVAAKQNFVIQFPLPEHVLNIMVKPGDHVKPNQPLIRFDTTQLNAQLQQAADNVTAARNYLDSVASVGINPIAVAAAQHAYQVANNHYHALTAQTNGMTLHNGNLVSPVNGIVITVLVNPGENFGANAVLMTLMDQSSVLVHTQLPLANLQQIHVNAAAQIVPSALPDMNLNGKVTAIIPQANPQTDTFQVDVSVANTQQSLLPVMSTFVRVQSQQTAFVVPRIAVLNPDNESTVFQVHNGHVYMHQVHVAGSAPNVFYVDSGLSPNDQIVVLPLNRLHDGQAITINTVE